MHALRVSSGVPKRLRSMVAALVSVIAISSRLLADDLPSQPPAPAPVQSGAADEIRRLRAYSGQLLEQLRRLRQDLAASEEARKRTEALLAETSLRSREELQQKQERYARETVRHEKEVTTTLDQLAALKAEEERKAARAAELSTALEAVQRAAEQGQAEKKKLEVELAALEQTRTEAVRTHAAVLEKRDREAKQMSARLEALQRAAEQGQAEKKKLETELATLEKARAEAMRTQAAALESRDREAKQLAARLEEAERSSRARSEDLDRQKRDLVVVQGQLDTLKAEKQRAVQLAAELEKLRGQANKQAARKDELEIQLARVSRQETERRHEETESLKARAGEVEKIRLALEAARQEGQRRLQRLEEQERELAAARKQLQEVQQVTEQRQHQATKLGSEIEKLQADAEQRAAEAAKSAAESVESVVNVGSLQRELEKARESERASRASAETLQQALAAEKETARSQIEALETVLRDTRSVNTAVHSELDAARRENGILTRQVGDFREAMSEVRDLQEHFRQTEIRIQEIAQQKNPNPRQLKSLRANQRSIEAKLRQARSKREAQAGSLNKLLATEPPALAGVPPTAPAADGNGDPETANVREQLSIERERRETLEGEVRRLTSASDPEERSLEVWKALQSARAEILVLGNQLAEERRSREDLEIALTRMTHASGVKGTSGGDAGEKLAAVLRDRRAEADRLATELKNANEVITRLKGRLEAKASSGGEASVVAELEQENFSLRAALGAAEEANRSLRTKAELAERLAGMVYGKSIP